jgi:hypothetical protein
MKAIRPWCISFCALLSVVVLSVLIPLPLTWANTNEAPDLVAPYVHVPFGVGPAPGPFTTHYLVSNTTGFTNSVNVKCFNDGGGRVGPAAGITIALSAFEMEVRDPVSLGLTGDLSFTGVGWCYFASDAGGGNDDVAVTFLMGASVGGNLITTNDSRGLMADTAQGQVTIDDANIPYWTQEGSWGTFIFALNPTATSRTVTMDVYNPAGALLGTWPGDGPFAARDLDFTQVVDAVPAAAGGFGMADIEVSGRGFVGWVIGFNGVSTQAFIYPIALDKDDTSALVPADRP